VLYKRQVPNVAVQHVCIVMVTLAPQSINKHPHTGTLILGLRGTSRMETDVPEGPSTHTQERVKTGVAAKKHSLYLSLKTDRATQGAKIEKPLRDNVLTTAARTMITRWTQDNDYNNTEMVSLGGGLIVMLRKKETYETLSEQGKKYFQATPDHPMTEDVICEGTNYCVNVYRFQDAKPARKPRQGKDAATRARMCVVKPPIGPYLSASKKAIVGTLKKMGLARAGDSDQQGTAETSVEFEYHQLKTRPDITLIFLTFPSEDLATKFREKIQTKIITPTGGVTIATLPGTNKVMHVERYHTAEELARIRQINNDLRRLSRATRRLPTRVVRPVGDGPRDNTSSVWRGNEPRKQKMETKKPASNDNNNSNNNVEVDRNATALNPTPSEARDFDRMNRMERMFEVMQVKLNHTLDELRAAKEEVAGLRRTIGQRDELVESMRATIAKQEDEIGKLKEPTKMTADDPAATTSTKQPKKPRQETPAATFIPNLSPTQGVVSKIDFIDLVDEDLLSDTISVHVEGARESDSTDDEDDVATKTASETSKAEEAPNNGSEDAAKAKATREREDTETDSNSNSNKKPMVAQITDEGSNGDIVPPMPPC
jgi:hypothetical protein